MDQTKGTGTRTETGTGFGTGTEICSDKKRNQSHDTTRQDRKALGWTRQGRIEQDWNVIEIHKENLKNISIWWKRRICFGLSYSSSFMNDMSDEPSRLAFNQG
jgi:hypothetical protein